MSVLTPTAMIQQHTRPSLPRDDSNGSLNISDLIHTRSSDNLLAVSLSLPESTSTHSFGDVPDFPHTKCSPVLFVNLTRTPILTSPGTQSLGRPSEVLISVPTVPRMRVMLLEPISVTRWSEQTTEFAPGSVQTTGTDSALEDREPLPWKPEGRLHSPESFRTMLQERRTSRRLAVHAPTSAPVTTPSVAQAVDISGNDLNTDSIVVNCSMDTDDKSPRSARVPTITLSNSSAVIPMPLSLESSQCITSLAARRGLKGPAPLELSVPTADLAADGLYPGIPTPFLGSPSGYSPTFEFAADPTGFALDLATMCRELRSRCPPLHPPSPPRGQTTSISTLSCDSDSSDAPGSDSDSDDWAFAKDILATHGELPDVKIVKDHVIEELPDTASEEGDELSLDSAPTLTDSPESDEDSTPATPEQASKDPAHQRRRRTVIIETPRNSMSAKPARITVDLSHLADDSDDTPPVVATTDPNTPLPVEVRDSLDFAAALQSTPCTRPTSTATLRPIRSILKTREKKRVRFSLMPGQGGDSTDDVRSGFDDDNAHDDVRGRERAATIPPCRRRASSPHHARASVPQAFVADRVSFPKHPAVKSLKRLQKADVTPTPPSKNPKARQSLQLVPRVVDKRDVGAPKKLSSQIARRSMPAEVQKCTGRRCSRDENAGRRHSEEPTKLAQKISPQKSRMPFRSILDKFRV